VKRSRSPDFWSGLALAGLGAYIVLQARGWEYLGEEGPGPGFFPFWFGIAMVALSAFLMLRPTDARVDWRGTGRALATWAALAVSVAMMKVVGFLIGFAALAFFLVLVMYGRRVRTAVLVAAATAAGFYIVFPLALGVALP
jgi:putative tricarboxylic transport membrane protein